MRRERSAGPEGRPLRLAAAVRMWGPTGRSSPGTERRIGAVYELKEKLGGSDWQWVTQALSSWQLILLTLLHVRSKTMGQVSGLCLVVVGPRLAVIPGKARSLPHCDLVTSSCCSSSSALLIFTRRSLDLAQREEINVFQHSGCWFSLRSCCGGAGRSHIHVLVIESKS